MPAARRSGISGASLMISDELQDRDTDVGLWSSSELRHSASSPGGKDPLGSAGDRPKMRATLAFDRPYLQNVQSTVGNSTTRKPTKSDSLRFRHRQNNRAGKVEFGQTPVDKPGHRGVRVQVSLKQDAITERRAPATKAACRPELRRHRLRDDTATPSPHRHPATAAHRPKISPNSYVPSASVVTTTSLRLWAKPVRSSRPKPAILLRGTARNADRTQNIPAEAAASHRSIHRRRAALSHPRSGSPVCRAPRAAEHRAAAARSSLKHGMTIDSVSRDESSDTPAFYGKTCRQVSTQATCFGPGT